MRQLLQLLEGVWHLKLDYCESQNGHSLIKCVNQGYFYRWWISVHLCLHYLLHVIQSANANLSATTVLTNTVHSVSIKYLLDRIHSPWYVCNVISCPIHITYRFNYMSNMVRHLHLWL